MSESDVLLNRPVPVFSPWKRMYRAASRAQLRWWFRLVGRRHLDRVVVERVAGYSLVVLPTVFNPRLFRSGAFFAESLDATLVPPSSSVLDLGTGTGILGVVAATWAKRVVAVDVNPEAVRCARINALLNRCDEKMEVWPGDLFEPVDGERFDLILFNPPFYRGVPFSASERAWRSIDVVDRFAVELSEHLTPNGRALVVLSTDGETGSFVAGFHQAGLVVARVAERVYPNETFTVFALSVQR